MLTIIIKDDHSNEDTIFEMDISRDEFLDEFYTLCDTLYIYGCENCERLLKLHHFCTAEKEYDTCDRCRGTDPDTLYDKHRDLEDPE